MTIKKLIEFKKRYRDLIYLTLIICLAFYLRSYGVNWDSNYYFHPDERAIAMFTIPLKFVANINDFLNPNSPLNPHFFAYGNFPLYLLKIISEIAGNFNSLYKIYGGIHLVGRTISALSDTLTVLFVFLICKKIFSIRAGLFASLFYALSVFSIQVSHFYAVDTLLTFFMTANLYILILMLERPSIRKGVIVGLLFGLALATKISSLILIFDIVFAFGLIIFLNNKKSNYLKYIFLVSSFVFFATQPYALIDFQEFLRQTREQSQMTRSAFAFPYTLQYVGITPYFYELKNIFLWGEGILIALLSFIGAIILAIQILKKKIKKKILMSFLLFYAFTYFLFFGGFAVGWMRYMLPLYPVLAIFGGFMVSEILIPKLPSILLKKYLFKKALLFIFLSIMLIYPLSFISIYNYPNTRIQASDWINKNIPPGKIIAVEHWDDALPVYGASNYTQLILPLYDPDTKEKWVNVNSILRTADYLIIASNRLYIPLQKLTDCKHLPINHCYPLTALYYKNLFSGKSNYKKVAEFTNYPTIPFTNIKIIDDNADESFTVYDHPKVMIFKKNSE